MHSKSKMDMKAMAMGELIDMLDKMSSAKGEPKEDDKEEKEEEESSEEEPKMMSMDEMEDDEMDIAKILKDAGRPSYVTPKSHGSLEVGVVKVANSPKGKMKG